MINEITINSNNTIQMSRGQLLNWLNDLLKINLSKIQQLGTGAYYCQLIDVIYPGKIPLNKVNWKAKFQYEFVANFKVLQQTFTKLQIMKHIEVQKLIKCKYQDNLEFLQWFKKIFDNNGLIGKQYNAVQKRGQTQLPFDKKKEKQNRINISGYTSKSQFGNNQKSTSQKVYSISDRTDQSDSVKNNQQINDTSAISNNPHNTPVVQTLFDSPQKQQLNENAFKEQRQFYLKKFKQIEHLFQQWNIEKCSQELISSVRKIIMMPPEVDWKIQQGQIIQHKKQHFYQ